MLSYKTFFTWLEISLYQGQSVSTRLSVLGTYLLRADINRSVRTEEIPEAKELAPTIDSTTSG